MKNLPPLRVLIGAGFAVVVLLLILSGSMFVVDQRERALLVQFGRVVAPNLSSGLHFKIPLVQDLYRFDARLQNTDLPEDDYQSSEQKRLTVDAYFVWRIEDLLKFFVSTRGNMEAAEDFLTTRVISGLQDSFGQRTITELVSGDRDGLTRELTRSINAYAERELGVEVVDVRIKRLDFNEEISDSVFERMRSAREQDAQNIRSKGQQDAVSIEAEADRQAAFILADSLKQAETLKGEGDKQASRVLSEAFAKNPRYFKLYQRAKTLDDGLLKGPSIFVLNPQDDPVDALLNGHR